MGDDARSTYCFGNFRLDTRSHRLYRAENEVEIPPKAFELLELFLRRPDELLSKQQLLDAVWPGTAVVENTLPQRIREIRDALGDDARVPRYLETVPRLGYRFIAPVTSGQESRRRRGPLLAATLLIISLAATLLALVGWPTRVGDLEAPRQQLVSTFSGSHRAPTVSPDAGSIAFEQDVDGISQIWVAPLSNGEPKQITHGAVAARRPRWSRTGVIVFERFEQGIWAISPLGGEPHRLVESGRNPNLSRDGAWLVFERPGEIWIARSDGSEPRRVAEGIDRPLTGADAWPALSPHGDLVVFFRQEGGPYGDLWLVSVDGVVVKTPDRGLVARGRASLHAGRQGRRLLV